MASIFDDNKYPALAQILNNPVSPNRGGGGSSNNGLISGALSSGIDQLQSLGGSAIGWTGNLIGSRPLQDLGEGIADRNNMEAARNGRSDLESFPTDDWTKVPKWALYKTIQQLPTIGAIWATSKLPGLRATGNLLPNEAKAAGAYVPEILGGGGAKLSTDWGALSFAQKKAGVGYANNVAAMAAAGYPMAVGSMYDEARQAGPVSRADALKMGFMGVPYAAMEALEPKQLERLVTKGLTGSLPKRVAMAGLAGAAQEVPTEGIQTAMEQSFRPDLSPREKAANIVEAAVTGGVVGGLLGGAAGIRKMKTVEPNKIANDDLKSVVDQTLNGGGGEQYRMPGMEPAPATDRPFAAMGDEEMQQRLATIQQNSIQNEQRQNSAFNSAFLPSDAVEPAGGKADIAAAAQLRAEMDLRDRMREAGVSAEDLKSMTLDQARLALGDPSENSAPRFTSTAREAAGPTLFGKEGELDTPEKKGFQGTATLRPYSVDIQPVAQATATENAGPAPTSQDRNQYALDLFDQSGNLMPRRVAPEADTTDVPQITEEEKQARAVASKLIGGEKARWQKAVIERGAKTNEQVIGNVMAVMEDHDKANATMPKGLIEAAQKLGILNSRGKPRDLDSELRAAEKQSAVLWNRAKATGKPEDLKSAQAFQNKQLADLQAAQTRLAAAKTYLAEQRAQEQVNAAQATASTPIPTPTPAPTVPGSTRANVEAAVTAPGAGLKLDVKQDNPAVTDNDPQWLEKRQMNASLQPDGKALKGSMTAWTTKPVTLPLSVVSRLPAAGKVTQGKIKRLTERVAKVGWKNDKPITVKVNHRGEAFIEDGNARVVAAVASKQANIPVHIEWMNGAELSNTAWNPNKLYDLVQEGKTPPLAKPTSAASPENIKRLNQERVIREKLGRIANSDTVSRDLKNKADDALRMMESYAENAIENAGQVLKEASETHVSYSEAEMGNTPDAAIAKAAERYTNAPDMARWLQANSWNKVHRAILAKILPVMENAPIHVVKIGDQIPMKIARLLNGSASGAYFSDYDTGERALYVRADHLTEGLMVHELIHAATNTRLREGNLVKNKDTELFRVTQEFYVLQRAVAMAYREMVRKGIRSDLTQITTVQAAASSPYELATYAFTDPNVQEFFRLIPYNRTTSLWTKFVTLVRDLFGIPASQQNALTAIIDLSEQLVNAPLKSEDSALSVTEKGLMSWTEDRLERELQDSHYNDNQRSAKSWVAWVNPVQFLDATSDAVERAQIEKSSDYYNDPNRISGNEQTPFLEIKDGRVVGHEGRHRMAALSRKGVTAVPVVVKHPDKIKTPVASMVLNPQNQSTGPVTLNDMIPLNRDYTAAIKERMAKGSATFSDGGEGYVYIVHGGSDFDQIDLSNSGRGEPGNIRPLGKGLYGYVIDTNNPDEAVRAINGAKNYSTKYARGVKTLHVFRVPRGAEAGWVGYHHPIPGLGVSRTAEYQEWERALNRAEALPYNSAERDEAMQQVKALHPAMFARMKPEDMRAHRLPIDLTEVSILNPAVAERVGKWPLAAGHEEILDALAQDGNTSVTAALATPQGMMDNAKKAIDAASNFKSMFDSRTWKELSLAGNRFNLYTSTVGHIVAYYGKMFDTVVRGIKTNGLRAYYAANKARNVVEQRLGHLSTKVYAAYEALSKVSPDAAAKVLKLMGYTFFDVDPRKTWAEQTWLHREPNADVLQKHANEANAIYRKLGEPNNVAGKAALAVYHDFINLNEALHLAQQAVSLHNLMSTDEGVLQEVKDKLSNPMDEFLADTSTYDNAKASRDFWFNKVNAQVKEAREYMDQQRGGTDAVIARGTSAINARVEDILSEQKAMDRSPYFHIGRFGDHVLAFDIAKDANGKVDPRALDRIATAFEKAGITGVEIPRDANRANAYIRFENIKSRDDAFKLAQELEKQGVLMEPKHFNRKDEKSPMDTAPQWMERLMAHIRTTPVGGDFKLPGVDESTLKAINGEFQRNVQQFFLNMLPDIAVNKVMVHRNYVPGFSSDMVRSYLFRTQVGGRALANLYASAKMSEATKDMVQVAKDAQLGNDPKRAQIIQNTVTELFKREAQRPMMVKNDYIDTAVAMNHAYFLGMSPSYVAVNLTQVGVLLWPELSKKHSFVKSAQAISRVTPLAFKILKKTMADGKAAGWKHFPDASITRQGLKEAGVNDKDANFVMRVVLSGLLDIGSQTREQARVIEGRSDSKTELALRWASAAGYYSEMFTRLIAALSARELHGEDGTVAGNEALHEYVTETVNQSMLQYETWNRARATGKMGLAGEFTPIMTSFMQYTFQVTEKLFRELHDAFKGETAAERKASRDFLMAHLAAMTALTGTLGMPMAAVFAAVFDKLKDGFGDPDDEPSNIQASFRNLMSDMLGKDAAEIVTRGLPRAIGIDVSQRAGEQNLLPYGHMFARLLTDRRKWDDVAKEWALDTLGSPVSMISNIVKGGGQIATGNVWDGMQSIVPNAIKGPMKAYSLSDDGYVDGKGNKMPMSSGAWDVLTQAMGFTPSAKAEYSEARGVQQTLKGDMYRRASDIRKNLTSAIESGDMDAARQLYAEAMQFDQKNPGFRVLHGLKSTLASRAREREKARRSGTPLGIDPQLADRTRFANFGD